MFSVSLTAFKDLQVETEKPVRGEKIASRKSLKIKT